MDIDHLEDVPIGNSVQSIRVRGTDRSNPVLLLVQQGPGLPMINEVRRFERLLGLEQDFTVVYWDQRGCGRSLRTPVPAADVTVAHMVDDTVVLLDLLRDRYGGPVVVAGFSLGAAVALSAAARRPDLVATIVAVGTDVDGVAAATNAYDFALDGARVRSHRRAIGQLESIGPPPHLDIEQFVTRARWALDFGGVTTGATYRTVARDLALSLAGSSAYTTGEVMRIMRGITQTQAALLSDLATLDLFEAVPALDVPVVMAQGRLDQVAPARVAIQYADALRAPEKALVWFEHSAHTPQLEEPDVFRDLLMQVRASAPTQT